MAFQAGNTFVFGEQPSASKMDQLWRNDDALQSWGAFTNGTFPVALIDDLAIPPNKIENPYCFAAISNSNSTLTDDTWSKVSFGSELYDLAGDYDHTTSVYTAPVEGIYHFDARVGHNGTSASPVEAYTAIYVNGVLVATGNRFAASTGSAFGWTVNFDVSLEVGDTVEIYHNQNSAGGELSSSDVNTRFSGHLVTEAVIA